MAEPQPHAERCSFCRKNRASVRYLIAAPQAAICDECTVLSMRVLVENGLVAKTTLLGLFFR